MFTLRVRYTILGIVTVLFFRCMSALLNGSNKRIQWPLVAHTVAMFSFVTVYTAMYLNIQSICFIDNREYPGTDGGLPPGPVGYQHLIYNKAISFVPHIMFMLNTWLADGLLVSSFSTHPVFRDVKRASALQLYRCYIIYSMNFWVIAFPCLIYIASFGVC